MSKILASITLAAAALASVPASAEQFLDFTINENSVPGTAGNAALVADKLNGGFTEYLAFTSPNTFSAAAHANIGQLFKNEGVDLASSRLNFNGSGLPSPADQYGYGMYALFNASGTFSGLNFTGTSADFYLYIDPNQDTTFNASNGLAPVTTNNSSDDYLIAYSTTLNAPGAGTLTSAPGAYNFDFKDFTLTTGDQDGNAGNGVQNGELYFIQPRPFHFFVQVNGDNDRATGTNPLVVTGDVSAVFTVPEPGSLALVGLMLSGLGLFGRARRS